MAPSKSITPNIIIGGPENPSSTKAPKKTMEKTWGQVLDYQFFLVCILSEEEEVRLLETVRTSPKEKHLEPIIITALHTEMRKGEILNLKWSNVDSKN